MYRLCRPSMPQGKGGPLSLRFELKAYDCVVVGDLMYVAAFLCGMNFLLDMLDRNPASISSWDVDICFLLKVRLDVLKLGT